MKAILLLEDGTVFEGTSFAAKGSQCGEVVFNTAMTGYEEILTDPSYYQQIITMTYPLIGNYGVNPQDVESRAVFARGFIVRENCPCPSSWRSAGTIEDYLKKSDIVGLCGIDTRALVRHIRTAGAMRGIISSDGLSMAQLKKKLAGYPGLVGVDIVKDVTSRKAFRWEQGAIDIYSGHEPARRNCRRGKSEIAAGFNVVAFDFGIKYNILRLLRQEGCNITVVPADTPAKAVLAKRPDGVFLSNGPGDPAAVTYAIDTVGKLLGKVPIFGICLGHQILSLALGGKTFKLKFGHRGANHPVKNLDTGKIEITSQNHGFCADIDSLKGRGIEITHINLNDNTLEGIRCSRLGAFSVQYHPEASPGPHDSRYLFGQFTGLMKIKKPASV